MAAELIKTLNEGVLSAVKAKISAHQKVFEAKPEIERRTLLDATASIFDLPSHNQHSCTCPACGGQGKVTGSNGL